MIFWRGAIKIIDKNTFSELTFLPSIKGSIILAHKAIVAIPTRQMEMLETLAEAKNRILDECGITVAKSVAEIGNKMKESLILNV